MPGRSTTRDSSVQAFRERYRRSLACDPVYAPALTRAALRHAGVYSDLEVYVSLVAVQVVPFPCPLDQPPINCEYSRGRLQGLFDESRLPGHAAVLYARDWLDGCRRVLEPTSLVILATKRR